LRTIEVPYGSKPLFELLLEEAAFFKEVTFVEYYEESCWAGPEMTYSAFSALHGECSVQSREDRQTNVLTCVFIAEDGTIVLPNTELNNSILNSFEFYNNLLKDKNKIKIRKYHFGENNIFVAYE